MLSNILLHDVIAAVRICLPQKKQGKHNHSRHRHDYRDQKQSKGVHACNRTVNIAFSSSGCNNLLNEAVQIARLPEMYRLMESQLTPDLG
jgi:hypothetical protein